ncbi:MAG: autotransporter domain-containing protein [Fusobacterium varium]|uniref:autotransporter domain-containing protein n=1 Tax=Fusobacterium varium TaxID=856 RepID=UPI0024329FE4|nr:autotransporter domain-containing protein [Fusobacterium varium]UYI77376.1 MAG: autotransporter domain-containing protein [Fusobacterium varium]
MIEKIMKAVKRGNKRRSRNITIGAVIGFLLSCTAVAGADEYLYIKDDNGIQFSTNGNVWDNTNPYEDAENIWDTGTNTYVNNIELIGENNIIGSDTSGYGVKLEISNNSNFKFVNNGDIYGSATSTEITKAQNVYGYGMNISEDVESITNSGYIVGSGSNSEIFQKKNAYGYGMKISGEIGTITNSGYIFGSGINNGDVTEKGEETDSNGYGYGMDISGNVETIINSGYISSTGRGKIAYIGNGSIDENIRYGQAYGINISSGKIGNIINNGDIHGYVDMSDISSSVALKGQGIGINVEASGEIGNIVNTGRIYINIDYKSNAYGGTDIYGINANGKIGNIINNGYIFGENAGSNPTANGDGIRIEGNGTITNITNSGYISGKGKGAGHGSGIYIDSNGEVQNIVNTGYIFGYGASLNHGIVNMNGKNLSSIVNSGIISGKSYSILSFSSSLPVSNNGLLIGGLLGVDPTKNNNGLIFTVDEKNGTYEITNRGSDTTSTVIVGYDQNGGKIEKKYTIKNAEDISSGGSSTVITGTESILASGLGDESYILNGITDTLKVDKSGEIKDSIVNAYTTAIIVNDNNIEFSINDTIVNGGVDRNSPVIKVEGDNNTLTVQGESIVNGDMESTGANNVLNLYGKMGIEDSMNIFHKITGFEKMKIENNVALFENAKVTGSESITVSKDGNLTLRIDKNITEAGKIIGHALYENVGTISSEGGKLILALNGVGNQSIISFGNNILDSSLMVGDTGTFDTNSKLHTIFKISENEVKITVRIDIPEILEYKELNKIYHGILNVDDLIGNFYVNSNESLSVFLGYLDNLYKGSPYSYSSELSRKSVGMFRDIAVESQFKPELNKWLIMGGLTHVDGGTKDTYYGKGYYTYDIGSVDMDADTKITGAYMLGEYGVSDTLTYGVVIGGNKLKSNLSNGSKVDGDALYMGAYAKKYIGNLKVTGGLGLQYGDYDADRFAAGKGITETRSYSDNYNDMTYDIYLNGRYSHNIGENLFLEPYGTLSYTYVDQEGADEGSKVLAIETDSKSFDYTAAKVGVDLKKVIPHEKGKSTLSAGVSYTRLLNGADEENITGRFKGGSDFDILVAHKNEHSIGLNAKYALELENGILFDVKGSYNVERDSHNGSGKNRAKSEWIVGAGIGYKF